MGKVFGPTSGARTTESPRATMQWLVDDDLADGAGQSVARMTLKPGAVSEAHRHPNCSEVVHLISGRIEQVVGDASYVLTPGDTAFIPIGYTHQSRNLQDENAEMLISYSAGRRVYETAD